MYIRATSAGIDLKRTRSAWPKISWRSACAGRGLRARDRLYCRDACCAVFAENAWEFITGEKKRKLKSVTSARKPRSTEARKCVSVCQAALWIEQIGRASCRERV